jgi:hypothetical protein
MKRTHHSRHVPASPSPAASAVFDRSRLQGAVTRLARDLARRNGHAQAT